jgi:hypothetical protein
VALRPIGVGDGFNVNGSDVSQLIAGVAMTATAAEINKLAGVTGGTATASKAVVLDANKAIDANFLLKLGAAITVQSPPLAGLPADVVGAASGTTQSTFYALASVTIPANALSVNGKGLEFRFAGTTAGQREREGFPPALRHGDGHAGHRQHGQRKPWSSAGAIYRTGAGAQFVVAEITVDTVTTVTVRPRRPRTRRPPGRSRSSRRTPRRRRRRRPASSDWSRSRTKRRADSSTSCDFVREILL